MMNSQYRCAACGEWMTAFHACGATPMVAESQLEQARKELKQAKQERDCALSDTSVKHKYRADVLESQLEQARQANEEMRKDLKFYADGKHFFGMEEWDTVSGEGGNWLFPQYDADNLPPDFDFPEGIETGEIAARALSLPPLPASRLKLLEAVAEAARGITHRSEKLHTAFVALDAQEES